jgi:hypothetical protein
MTAARRSWLVALLLAAALSLTWAAKDWANLAALRLPDTDDAMRLQQIRDWLGGQAFADLSQHRLAGGLPMHWSRLPDLVPGGLIAFLSPVAGRHAAEVAAVILWPALLFAAALALTGRIARVQLAPVVPAIVIAALAFPATGLFLPGRIDHHGLQLVLLLGIVVAMLHPRGIVSGAWIGALGTISLTIGLETAPFVALACALVVLGWIAEREGADRHLAALGGTLAAALLLARLLLAPEAFAWPACDGFTLGLLKAAGIGAAALLVLSALGPVVAGRGPRLLLAAAVGGLALVVIAIFSPACLDPYGGVDADLAARWLALVGEAQPLFAAPLATAIGQCGLMAAGILAGGWALWRTRDPGWAILLLFQLTAAAISIVQLRGAWAGALLAAPALAMLVGAARARGPLALVAAWATSAGILYPLAAQALPAAPGADRGAASCANPAAFAALDRLPPGLVVAPIDFGAWGIAATRHRFLSAPYHRNNAGNRAAFAVMQGPPERARVTLTHTGADYLVACGREPGWLVATAVPWLRPVARGGGATVYAMSRLPPPAARP